MAAVPGLLGCRVPVLVAPSLASLIAIGTARVRSASTATAHQVGAPTIRQEAPIRKGHRVAVILRQQLDNLGHNGEEVRVAPGYARNYLIPRKLAIYATETNRSQFKVALSGDEAVASTAERSQNMLKARISAIMLLFSRATSDGQALYGAITRADIVEALADTPLRNLKISEANVKIAVTGEGEAALKMVGDHTVEIEPARSGYPGLWCTLKVRVRSS